MDFCKMILSEPLVCSFMGKKQTLQKIMLARALTTLSFVYVSCVMLESLFVLQVAKDQRDLKQNLGDTVSFQNPPVSDKVQSTRHILELGVKCGVSFAKKTFKYTGKNITHKT